MNVEKAFMVMGCLVLVQSEVQLSYRFNPRQNVTFTGISRSQRVKIHFVEISKMTLKTRSPIKIFRNMALMSQNLCQEHSRISFSMIWNVSETFNFSVFSVSLCVKFGGRLWTANFWAA